MTVEEIQALLLAPEAVRALLLAATDEDFPLSSLLVALEAYADERARVGVAPLREVLEALSSDPLAPVEGYRLVGRRTWVGRWTFVQRIDLPGMPWGRMPWGRFVKKVAAPGWWVSCYRTRREAAG